MGIDIDIDNCIDMDTDTNIDSKKLEHGCRMIYAVASSFFGLSLEDGDVPTFWLPL